MSETKEQIALRTLAEASIKYSSDQAMIGYGNKMFELYTAHGLPPDMFLDELNKRTPLDLLAKVFIVSEYHTQFLEHKRLSGIEDKRIDKVRRRNRDEILALIRTGELGRY